MSVYLPCQPKFGILQYILSEYGGRRTTIEDIIIGDCWSESQDEVLICIQDFGIHEAAVIMPPVPRFMLLENKEFKKHAYYRGTRSWAVVKFRNLPEKIKEVLTRANA